MKSVRIIWGMFNIQKGVLDKSVDGKVYHTYVDGWI